MGADPFPKRGEVVVMWMKGGRGVVGVGVGEKQFHFSKWGGGHGGGGEE